MKDDKPFTSLREKYGIPEPSEAWELSPQMPIIRFWIDERKCIGVAFSKVASILYEEDKLAVNAEGIGTFLVEGPKVLKLFEQLASHHVGAVKVDKKDIHSIRFIPPKKKED
jgi:hypothetical protein